MGNPIESHHLSADGRLSGRSILVDRWPTALALVMTVGAIVVMALVGREAEHFGPTIALMAGIYMVAYVIGKPWTAWLAFVALSVVVTALHLTDWIDPAVGMTVILVVLWLCAVAQRRFTDGRTFAIQTAGMVAFGALTLACAAVDPRLGAALAGVGFIAHGLWDFHHFKTNQVVNRPWSELCGVVDLLVGTALIVSAVI